MEIIKRRLLVKAALMLPNSAYCQTGNDASDLVATVGKMVASL